VQRGKERDKALGRPQKALDALQENLNFFFGRAGMSRKSYALTQTK